MSENNEKQSSSSYYYEETENEKENSEKIEKKDDDIEINPNLAVPFPQTEADKKIPMSDHVLLTSLDDAVPGNPTLTVTLKDENQNVKSYQIATPSGSAKVSPRKEEENEPKVEDDNKESAEEIDINDVMPDENETLQINLAAELANLHKERTQEKLPMNDSDKQETAESENSSGESQDSYQTKEKRGRKNSILTAAFDSKKPRVPAYIEEQQEEFNTYIFKYSNDELERELKKILKKKQAPSDINLVKDLQEYTKMKNEEAIDAEDYDYASQLDVIINLLQKAIAADQASYDNSQKTQQIKSRLETVEQRQQRLKTDYEQKMDYHKRDTQRRLEQLEQEHQQELESFEQQWSSPEAMQQYTKPSKQLLTIRRRQRQLALAHDFEQAKYLKSIAEEMEQKETEEARKKAAEAMKASYLVLLNKQEKERECIIANSERKAKKMESEYQKSLSSNEITQKTLQNMMTATPKKPQVTVPQVDYRSHVGRARPKSSFKKVTEGPRLDVKIDIKSITKNKTPRIKI